MKKFIITIVSILILALIGTYAYFNGYTFTYASPYNNNKAYPYIATSTLLVNQIIYDAVEHSLKEFNKDARVLYVNGYGSGLLKGNEASSDYDYSVAVNLGKYKYTGTNENSIAKVLLNQIIRFQNAIYASAAIYPEFEIQSMPKDARFGPITLGQRPEIIGESIKKAIQGKPYSLLFKKRNYLFSEDEILLTKFTLVRLFSRRISYSRDYRRMLRELTIYCEFYVDIEDENGNIKTYEMVTEAAGGRRDSQNKYKKFIPNVFTDANSIDFAREFYKFKDNEEYLTLRMASYCSHYVHSDFLEGDGAVSPLKVLKRILQDAYAFHPILDKKKANEIVKETSKVLQDKGLIALNDFYVAAEIIENCTKSKKSMKKFSSIIKGLNKTAQNIVNDLRTKYGYTDEELKPLDEFNEFIKTALENRDEYQPQIQEKIPTKEVYKLMSNHIPDRQRFYEYNSHMSKILEPAGIYKVESWQDAPNHIYIMKDDFTKNIPVSEYPKMEQMQGYQVWAINDDTVFELMNRKDFDGDIRFIMASWVRYKPTPEQDAVWKEMQDKFLKDKKHYNLKIRFGVAR